MTISGMIRFVAALVLVAFIAGCASKKDQSVVHGVDHHHGYYSHGYSSFGVGFFGSKSFKGFRGGKRKFVHRGFRGRNFRFLTVTRFLTVARSLWWISPLPTWWASPLS